MYNGLNESAGFYESAGFTSGKSRARKRERTQSKTAKLSQPRPNMAAEGSSMFPVEGISRDSSISSPVEGSCDSSMFPVEGSCDSSMFPAEGSYDSSMFPAEGSYDSSMFPFLCVRGALAAQKNTFE